MNVFSKLGHSISSKNIRLPPIPSFKPINLSSLDIFKSKDDAIPSIPAEIRRKPCPSRADTFESTTPTTPTQSSILYQKFRVFDPCAPATNPSLHKRARDALKRRYQSKFTVEFQPPPGVSLREYDFIWCDEGDLDMKVLQDVVWVRERYAQAKQGEPTDEDIIRWYDAERFDLNAASVVTSNEGSLY
ncbi:hypothetical protein EG329_008281 [Mollisiaceae sp. DMI_Dod_QoI]|nr:hypothetical protein EG329_008281 [Helotiales sp. DMI_Dod_QoI]